MQDAPVVKMAEEAASRRYRSIEINVGGSTFNTTEHTLAKADDNSLLQGLIDTQAQQETQNKIFFDRDPSLFEAVLYVLRTGRRPAAPNHSSPSSIHPTLTTWFKSLETEASFYCATTALKSAFSPSEFNGMDLTCKHMPLFDGEKSYTPAISALPEGDFVIALRNRLSWYDWSLSKLRTVVTPVKKRIDVLAHVNNSVVVAATSPLSYDATSKSALYFYDANHKFHRGCVEYSDYGCQSAVSGDGGRVILALMLRYYTEGAYSKNEKAVLKVDAETLQISRILAEHNGSIAHTKGNGRLQWIESLGLLLATYTGGYNGANILESGIKLFDVRVPKAEIMSCIEEFRYRNRKYGDVVWSEGHGKIFKVYKECGKGDSLMYAGDLRTGLGAWERCSAIEPTITVGYYGFDTRLIPHGKQLFSSSKQSLIVWDEVEESSLCFSSSNFDWGETNIRAMAFGGERLYVVRDGAKVVEVLETDYRNLL